MIDRLETKVQRLLASNIVGVFIWNFDGAIVDANEAFLEITGHDRGDLISGRMRWSELTPIEWRETDEQRLTVVRTIGDVEPYVKEFFRKDRSRVPVLLGASLFDRVRNEGVAFVVDLTDLRRAQDMARESERRYQGTNWSCCMRTASRPWDSCRRRSPMRSTSRSRQRSQMRIQRCNG